MEKIRVLQCINGLGSGGAEKDIINWMEELKSENIYFDFLIRSNDIFFEKEVLEAKGNIYVVASFPKHIIRNIKQTYDFLKINHSKYNAIHVHGNSTFYIIPLIFAKKFNIPIRIFHVHSTETTSFISNMIHKFNCKLLPKYANSGIGCSEKALKYANMKYGIVIKNMINKKDFFCINSSKDGIKKKYHVSEYKNIYIHIGRFLEVKNHKFLLEVFNEIKKIEPYSCLRLVGTGPLFEDIKRRVEIMNLTENVKFIGQTTSVNELLNISDLMIFPSLYEGIPLTMIEAQATKTKILASEKIDKESAISPYVKFYSLENSAKEWAKEAIAFLNREVDCDIEKCFKQANYDFQTEINKLLQIYKGKVVWK